LQKNQNIFPAGSEIMPNSTDIVQIVQEILADMPLKEKAALANLDEDKVPYLQYAFDACLKEQLRKDDKMGKDVMHRIWEVLQETHRVMCVKTRFIECYQSHVLMLLLISLPFLNVCVKKVIFFSLILSIY